LIYFLFFLGVMSAVGPAYAGSSPDEPTAAAAAPVSPAIPSPDVLKRARLAGYQVRKLRNGNTVFCKHEAHVGTRFSTDSCIDETQLEEFLLRAQSQRDSLKNRVGTPTDVK
jgi:hypothetical protein